MLFMEDSPSLPTMLRAYQRRPPACRLHTQVLEALATVLTPQRLERTFAVGVKCSPSGTGVAAARCVVAGTQVGGSCPSACPSHT
jgi:hypothetical protein